MQCSDKIKMKLSVQLISYNNKKYLPFCLNSLAKQSFQDFSLMIIDNASKDDSQSFIDNYLKQSENKKLAEKTNFIKNSRNTGFAGAHNQAIQWSKSDYIFMMNPDILLHPNYLKEIITFLDKKPKVASCTGVIYRWDFTKLEKENTSIKNLAQMGKTNQIDSLGLKISKNHQITELKTNDVKEKNWKQKPLEIFGPSGALPVYRRQALIKTRIPLFFKSFKFYINQTKPKLYEYLDNDFFCYKEDVDLAYRLQLFGYQSFLVPKAVAWHDRTAKSQKKIIKNRKDKSNFINYHSYKNQIYFLIKNVPRSIWIRYGYQIFLYELVKFCYLIIMEQKTLLSLKELFANFSKIIKKRTYLQKKINSNGWKNIQKWLK